MDRRLPTYLTLMGLTCLAACNRVTSTSPPPREDRDHQVAQADPMASPTVDPAIEATEPADDSSASDGPDRVFDETRMIKPYAEWTEAETAAHALGRIGAAAVPDLIESLHDQDPAVRKPQADAGRGQAKAQVDRITA